MFEILTKSAHEQAGRLQVRSALNPMLWLIGIVLPFVLLGMGIFQENTAVLWSFFVLGAVPVVTACIVYVGFALYQPEKLQSEDYQLRQQALQMIQRGAHETPIDPASLRAIANPYLHDKDVLLE